MRETLTEMQSNQLRIRSFHSDKDRAQRRYQPTYSATSDKSTSAGNDRIAGGGPARGTSSSCGSSGTISSGSEDRSLRGELARDRLSEGPGSKMTGPGLDADGDRELSLDRGSAGSSGNGADDETVTESPGATVRAPSRCICVVETRGMVFVGQRRRVFRKTDDDGGVGFRRLSTDESEEAI